MLNFLEQFVMDFFFYAIQSNLLIGSCDTFCTIYTEHEIVILKGWPSLDQSQQDWCNHLYAIVEGVEKTGFTPPADAKDTTLQDEAEDITYLLNYGPYTELGCAILIKKIIKAAYVFFEQTSSKFFNFIKNSYCSSENIIETTYLKFQEFFNNSDNIDFLTYLADVWLKPIFFAFVIFYTPVIIWSIVKKAFSYIKSFFKRKFW